MTLSNWKGAWDHRSPQRRQRAKAGSTLQGPATAATAGGELSSRRHETVSHEAEAIRDAPSRCAVGTPVGAQHHGGTYQQDEGSEPGYHHRPEGASPAGAAEGDHEGAEADGGGKPECHARRR